MPGYLVVESDMKRTMDSYDLLEVVPSCFGTIYGNQTNKRKKSYQKLHFLKYCEASYITDRKELVGETPSEFPDIWCWLCRIVQDLNPRPSLLNDFNVCSTFLQTDRKELVEETPSEFPDIWWWNPI